MGEIEPLDDKSITHGMCEACADKELGAVAQSLVERESEELDVVGSIPTRTTAEYADSEEKSSQHTQLRHEENMPGVSSQ